MICSIYSYLDTYIFLYFYISFYRSSSGIALAFWKPSSACAFRYDFNCLDDALQTWHCVSMPESVFRKTVMGKAAVEPVPIDTKQKAALRRLERVTGPVFDGVRLENAGVSPYFSCEIDERRMISSQILAESLHFRGTYEFVVTVRKTQFVGMLRRRGSDWPPSI